MAATVLAAVLSVAAPMTIVSGLAALVAAVLLVARALPWKPWATRKVPMLWVLHVGHAWIAVSLFLRAGVDFGLDLPASAPDHAFTIGGIGVLTLGMMARTARGHTGTADRGDTPDDRRLRDHQSGGRGPGLRPDGGARTPSRDRRVGVLWALAFLLYLIEYAPIREGPRIDGRPG